MKILLAQLGGAQPNLQPLPHPQLPPPLLPPQQVPLSLWIVGALALLVLIAVVWRLPTWLRGKPKPLQMAKPLDEAKASLERLLEQAGQLPAAQTAAAVSMVLRRYLEQRYAVPASCRTTQELFESEARLSPAARAGGAGVVAPKAGLSSWQRFESLAQLWDRLAYAPEAGARENALELVRLTLDALDQEVA